MKKLSYVIFFIFLALFLFGCTGGDVKSAITDTIQNDTTIVTQKDDYQFTLSNYWVPVNGGERAIAVLLSGNTKFEKAYISVDGDTVLMTQSFDGEYLCTNLTKELMEHKELNTTIEDLKEREWCIGRGYEDDPSERTIMATTQCPNKFVFLLLLGPEKRMISDEKEFYKILESFKCLN